MLCLASATASSRRGAKVCKIDREKSGKAHAWGRRPHTSSTTDALARCRTRDSGGFGRCHRRAPKKPPLRLNVATDTEVQIHLVLPPCISIWPSG